ncbi:MAG: hypothetical protein DYG86_09530 [Chloroflexi bacterium CFX2]|nr:hypothetical protein [Chloroflexi bacterium CFX2]
MRKKSFIQFLDEIVSHIESTTLDNGNLYKLFESSPLPDFASRPRIFSTLKYEVVKFSEFFVSLPQFMYSLPENGKPGKWQSAPQKENYHRKNVFKLKTLSSIILTGEKGGFLFLAEGKGNNYKLKFEDLVYMALKPEDLPLDQQISINAQKIFYQTVDMGLAVSEIRLINNVSSLNPFLLWQFLIDSVNHQVSLRRKFELDLPDQNIPEVYREALNFAFANSKYLCGVGDTEMEEIINASASSSDFDSLSLQKQNELETRVESYINNDIATKFLGKAIAKLLFMPSRPFLILKDLLTQNAWSFRRFYVDEYELPSFIELSNSSDVDNIKKFHRIWYAGIKQELEWQVSLLQKLLGI